MPKANALFVLTFGALATISKNIEAAVINKVVIFTKLVSSLPIQLILLRMLIRW